MCIKRGIMEVGRKKGQLDRSFTTQHMMLSWTVILLTIGSFVTSTAGDVVCEDFSPCSCDVFDPYGLVIRCGDPLDHKPITALDVQKAFSRTKTNYIFWLDMVSLSPNSQSSDIVNIPADLLQGKRVDRIGVGCLTSGGLPRLRLEINKDAFRSSFDQTGHFELNGCDLSRLNLKFTTEMTRLISLSFSHATQFRGFPPALERVKSLRIYECLDFRHWNEIPVRFPRLESLFLDGNQLGDRVVNQLLKSIIKLSNGTSTLEQLSLWENKLTAIPHHLAFFTKLNYLNLFGNNIQKIAKGSISFSPEVKVTFLILTNNHLKTIDSTAFQGDFSGATVYLDYNYLTRFESTVYENLLDQMHQIPSSDAGLYVLNNPFDCNNICDIAWLIRDRRYLMSRLHGASCSNGTRFEDLIPEKFANCL